MTTEEDFQRALDANPDDHQTRLVFADWLQEHNDPRAEGYRALGTLRRRPLGNHPTNGYWLQEIPDSTQWTLDAEPATLPRDWAVLSQQYHNHGSRRNAENVAATAFAQLPQNRREEILGQQSAEKLTRRRLSRRRYTRRDY